MISSTLAREWSYPASITADTERFLDAGAHPDKAVDSRIALPADAFAPALWTDLRRIKPSVEECEANPRARSAVLRTAQRTEALWSEPATDADKRKGGRR